MPRFRSRDRNPVVRFETTVGRAPVGVTVAGSRGDTASAAGVSPASRREALAVDWRENAMIALAAAHHASPGDLATFGEGWRNGTRRRCMPGATAEVRCPDRIRWSQFPPIGRLYLG